MISIIIPNYNGLPFLPAFCTSLKKTLPASAEIIFIDNGSSDNSVKYFLQRFPQTVLIKNSQILGFAAAINQGIKRSHFDYVCLLNNDLTLAPNWFKQILQNIPKFPQAACFCGTVLNKTGTKIESQGISFDYSGKCLQQNNGQKHKKTVNRPHLVWGSSAAAVVYKKSALQKINYFDEKYFAYLEDVDVAFRLHQNGYQTLLVPQAICCHLGGGTSDRIKGFRARQTLKNWLYFIHKNYSCTQLLSHLPSIFIERLRNLSYLLKSICR